MFDIKRFIGQAIFPLIAALIANYFINRNKRKNKRKH